MFKKILNNSNNLILIFDKDLKPKWQNKTFLRFCEENNIKKIKDFISPKQIKHKTDTNNALQFNHSFKNYRFKAKSYYLNDNIILNFAKNLKGKKLYKLKYIDSLTKSRKQRAKRQKNR